MYEDGVAMRIREARIRDAKAIADMLPDDVKKTEEEVMVMIQKKETTIYVGTDFGANILGCAFGADKIYISSTCREVGALEQLQKLYE